MLPSFHDDMFSLLLNLVSLLNSERVLDIVDDKLFYRSK